MALRVLDPGLHTLVVAAGSSDAPQPRRAGRRAGGPSIFYPRQRIGWQSGACSRSGDERGRADGASHLRFGLRDICAPHSTSPATAGPCKRAGRSLWRPVKRCGSARQWPAPGLTCVLPEASGTPRQPVPRRTRSVFHLDWNCHARRVTLAGGFFGGASDCTCPPDPQCEDGFTPWIGGHETTLRVIPGAQSGWVDAALFYAQSYTVTPSSNRMGLRLEGQPLPRLHPAEMLSEPVCPGAVQVAHDGTCAAGGRAPTASQPGAAWVTADLPTEGPCDLSMASRCRTVRGQRQGGPTRFGPPGMTRKVVSGPPIQGGETVLAVVAIRRAGAIAGTAKKPPANVTRHAWQFQCR